VIAVHSLFLYIFVYFRVAVPVAVDVESILPTHKNFSPGLLLSLIHGMITVPQLQTGLKVRAS
jgi:hypothetical protein